MLSSKTDLPRETLRVQGNPGLTSRRHPKTLLVSLIQFFDNRLLKKKHLNAMQNLLYLF